MEDPKYYITTRDYLAAYGSMFGDSSKAALNELLSELWSGNDVVILHGHVVSGYGKLKTDGKGQRWYLIPRTDLYMGEEWGTTDFAQAESYYLTHHNPPDTVMLLAREANVRVGSIR